MAWSRKPGRPCRVTAVDITVSWEHTFYCYHGGGMITICHSLTEHRLIPPQFGGLWIRWFNRRRTSVEGIESLKSSPAKKSRWSFLEALENTSLASNINKLQDDMKMMRQSTSQQQWTLARMHRASSMEPSRQDTTRLPGEIIPEIEREECEAAMQPSSSGVRSGFEPRRGRWWGRVSYRFLSLS